jgi:photosynthetic reaction center cytochrome c subunit
METERRKLKPVFAFSLMLPLLLLSSAFAQNSPSPADSKKVEDVFKNIKALTGTPADQLYPTMQFFEASLGVGCGFCHSGAREADTPHKVTARRMIQMVRTINQDNFDSSRKVTCNTCHRGSALPVSVPRVADSSFRVWTTDSSNGAPVSPPTAGPPANEIFDRYLRSLGGEAALGKIATRIVKYTELDTANHASAMEMVTKGENGIMVTHGPIGDPMLYPDTVTGHDRTNGWVRDAYGAVRDTRVYELDEARLQDLLDLARHLKEILSNPESTQVRLEDQDVYQVRAVAFGRMPVALFFNRNSGNLIRLVYTVDSSIGPNLTEIDYSDFRDVQGTRFPFSWTIARPIGFQTIKVDQFQQNIPVDDSIVARPVRH